MSEVILDASALLAAINGEPGAEVVEETLDRAIISAVNLSEVVSKLTERGVSEAELREMLEEHELRVIPFDQEQAVAAGLLRAPTGRVALSFGDRACLALAMKLDLPALTAAKSWELLAVGAKVRLIR